jgi:hypothetical protein
MYVLPSLFILGGLLSFREAFKKKPRPSLINPVSETLPKRFGRGAFIFFGILFFAMAITIFIKT